MTDAAAWAGALAALGAIVGSFLATIVVRWPAGRSVVAGRSRCDGCGHVVRARDLVPVLGYLALRGRCRECGAPIDRHHLGIELLAMAVGAAAGWGTAAPAGMAGAVFGWLLLTLAALDLAAWWLPNRLVALLAAAGLAAALAGVPPALDDRVIGGVAGFAGLWFVAVAYRVLRRREGLGGGDPKLFGAIGMWLGWRPLPAVLLIACLVGLGVVAWRRLTGRPVTRHDAMPLGTLLAIAAYPAWLVVIASAG